MFAPETLATPKITNVMDHLTPREEVLLEYATYAALETTVTHIGKELSDIGERAGDETSPLATALKKFIVSQLKTSLVAAMKMAEVEGQLLEMIEADVANEL